MRATRTETLHPSLAAFTGLRGRRRYLRLAGRLDAALAAAIQALLDPQSGFGALTLECSRLQEIDPIGARSLAQTLAAQRARGIWIEIHGLSEPLRRRVSRHPLGAYCDPEDQLFGEPDREPRGWRASRH
jgi:anti-anti-sigma regulatory factor